MGVIVRRQVDRDRCHIREVLLGKIVVCMREHNRQRTAVVLHIIGVFIIRSAGKCDRILIAFCSILSDNQRRPVLTIGKHWRKTAHSGLCVGAVLRRQNVSQIE